MLRTPSSDAISPIHCEIDKGDGAPALNKPVARTRTTRSINAAVSSTCTMCVGTFPCPGKATSPPRWIDRTKPRNKPSRPGPPMMQGTTVAQSSSKAATERCAASLDSMQGQGVYSESKLAAQRSVAALLDDWATVVPCIIGGPGREGLFRGFVRSIQRGGLVAFPGQGNVRTHMVHVEDTAALIERVVRVRATGLFNAGAPSPLSISQWIGEIASELGVRSIRILRVPLAPIHLLSALTGYRLLAREQLLMLAQPHVLDVSRSLKLGWAPTRTNAQIMRETARHIADSPD